MLTQAIDLVERGWIPDPLTRRAVRHLLRNKLRIEEERDQLSIQRLLRDLNQGPIALHTEAANSQHYEVPAAFFQRVLGSHLKYSCGYWPEGVTTLDDSEAAMLALSCERAQLADGQKILELGCGWGSLSLWMAEHYPQSRITALSNSNGQRQFIEQQCAERNLHNLEVLTCDINDFDTRERFDRVVSIEMFEHMHNYADLLQRISHWLEKNGRLFVHIFSHRHHVYPYDSSDRRNWMARHFFTGGLMPSADLLKRFDRDMRVEQQWWLDGMHYQHTCNAWLARQDAEREQIMPLFREVYGNDAERWFQRWRMFFIACAELFGYAEGHEWGVSHYLMRRNCH